MRLEFNEEGGSRSTESLNELVDQSKYFGRRGALARTAEMVRLADMGKADMTNTEALMSHINVLYSAIGFCSKGDIFLKMRGLYLVSQLNEAVRYLKKEHPTHMGLDAGALHILMSVVGMNLELRKKLGVLALLPRETERLREEYWALFFAIRKLVVIENASIDPQRPFDLTPTQRLLLLAEGHLYKMCEDGIIPCLLEGDKLEKYAIRQRVWLYCMAHESSSNYREVVQTVCRLYRYIGNHAEAERIAKRANNQDQAHKARQ